MGKSLFKGVVKVVALTTAIAAGASTLFVFKKKKEMADKCNKLTCLGGKNYTFDGEKFEDESYGVLFGGLNFDFSGVVLKDNKAVLDVFVEYGGINIKVPREFNVKLSGTEDKGGVNNNTEYNEDDLESPLLIINYEVAYGGLNVKWIDQEELEDEEDYFVEEEDDTREVRIDQIGEN